MDNEKMNLRLKRTDQAPTARVAMRHTLLWLQILFFSFLSTSSPLTPLAENPFPKTHLSSPYPRLWLLLLGGDVETLAPAPPPHFSRSIRRRNS